MTNQAIDLDKRVAQYIALRDAVETMKKKHKEELKPYNELMDKIENVLLNHLNTTNQQSARTASGTVYKTTKRSATISDKSAFREFVIEKGLWDLADWKANAPACEDFIKENQSNPAGVNFSTRVEVNINRA